MTETIGQQKNVRVVWWYPDIYNAKHWLTVSLMHTRAADDLHIRFDSERDGWVITMDRTRDGEGYMETIVDKEQMAFIPAWNTAGAGK